jgi:membrane dipeptidase
VSGRRVRRKRLEDADVDAGRAPAICCAGPTASGRRALLAALLGAVAAACAGPGARAAARRERELHRQAADVLATGAVIDLHAHPGSFPRARAGELPLDALAEMAAGGVHAAFFAAVGDGLVIRREGGHIRNFRDPAPGELWASALGQLRRVRARANEGRLRLVAGPGDVRRARTGGIPAAILSCEGGDPLEGDVRRVQELFDLGVRSIQLVHYRINELGDIQTAPARHGGLTAAGGEVIAAMNRLGMVVDAAHASADTLPGILAASRTPVVVSHTGPAARRALRRHLSDDLLRAVAAGGGVIGVWPLTRRPEVDGTARFLDEIAYVRDVAGIEHVAVGTDMAGLPTFTSIPTYREFAPIPAALLARGFPDAEIRLLLGGNVQRVLDAALRG